VQNTDRSIFQVHFPTARSLDPQADLPRSILAGRSIVPDPDRSIPHGRWPIALRVLLDPYRHSPIGLRPALDPQVEVLPCLVELLPLLTPLTYRIR
jgi:hypothetical protein